MARVHSAVSDLNRGDSGWIKGGILDLLGTKEGHKVFEGQMDVLPFTCLGVKAPVEGAATKRQQTFSASRGTLCLFAVPNGNFRLQQEYRVASWCTG